MIKPMQKKYREAFLGYIYDTLTETKGVLTYDLTLKIFLRVLKDYFDKIVDVHTLSNVATALYFDFNKPSSFDINPAYGQLGNLLREVSDLEWLSKNKSEGEITKITNRLETYFNQMQKA